ncbi:MAG: HAD family hydrolase [Candidatus Bathyarchaeia archaeon]
MIKAILLDFDNTLHDTDKKFIEKLDGLFGMDGKTLYEIYLFKIHRELVHKQFLDKHWDLKFHCKLLLNFLNKDLDESLINEFLIRFKQAEEECWSNPIYFEDTIPFLDSLKSKGYKICLSTGIYAKEKAQGIEKFASKKYFDYAFGEDQISYSKTDPNFYKKILSIIKSSPNETISIGDTITHDIAPAKFIGIKAIWVNRKNTRFEFKDYIKPDFEVKNLYEVLEVLESFNLLRF